MFFLIFPGYWGDKCANICDCENEGKCDHITGECHCQSGFTGDKCEFSEFINHGNMRYFFGEIIVF